MNWGGAGQEFVNNSEGATNPHKKTYQLDTRARCVRKVGKWINPITPTIVCDKGEVAKVVQKAPSEAYTHYIYGFSWSSSVFYTKFGAQMDWNHRETTENA